MVLTQNKLLCFKPSTSLRAVTHFFIGLHFVYFWLNLWPASYMQFQDPKIMLLKFGEQNG